MEQDTKQNRIEEIASKWLTGKVSAEEQMEFNAWFRAGNELPLEIAEEYARSEDEHKQKIWKNIQKQLAQTKTHDRMAVSLWPRVRVAAGIAAAVATIVFGVWFFSPSRHPDAGQDLALASNDIAPGKNGATITLSTGQVIQLSDAKKGVIIDPTSLTYDDGSKGTGFSLQTETVVQMTASTTKGQTYEFTLPDGTHVFLNADSKIIFPSQFSGKERRILLEGEAYFAVKHNEKQPFKVESKGQVVEDIGTEFNINAYADEGSVKTTLVEGSASVSEMRDPDLRQDDGRVILTPNQQASLANGDIKVKTIDVAGAIAWKKGVFMYKETPLEEVMRQISRWYSVEVVYEKESLRQVPLGGSVSRYSNVSRILKTLENTGAVKFKIEGKKIIVKE